MNEYLTDKDLIIFLEEEGFVGVDNCFLKRNSNSMCPSLGITEPIVSFEYSYERHSYVLNMRLKESWFTNCQIYSNNNSLYKFIENIPPLSRFLVNYGLVKYSVKLKIKSGISRFSKSYLWFKFVDEHKPHGFSPCIEKNIEDSYFSVGMSSDTYKFCNLEKYFEDYEGWL